jgi:RNA polymerase sigma-70 factor (ECF subfamily)
MDVRGDRLLAELELLYEARLEAFVRTAAAITGDRESGRDAVHDAFVSTIRSRDQFRGDAPLEAWVWRVVIRAALKAREKMRDVPSRAPGPEDVAPNGHGEDTEAIQALIADLPERQKLTLYLRYYADLDYQQIADALGIKRGTVSAALHAAHTSLRERLTEVTTR